MVLQSVMPLECRPVLSALAISFGVHMIGSDRRDPMSATAGCR
jgi:hypothetical protein